MRTPVPPPTRSYCVWFSQRVGSTLLTQALEDTGIAGRPREWLNVATAVDLLTAYGAPDALALRDQLWQRATTDNGVLGLKYGMTERLHHQLTSLFAGALPGIDDPDGHAAWNAFFPACKHVFMTRRNKVRLAVSWWRAIRTAQWHLPARSSPPTVVGDPANNPAPADLIDHYSYDAIEHLFIEASLREADIQARFDRWAIVPHTVVYEDFIASYEATLRTILDFLELPAPPPLHIPAPAFAPLADEVSETWTERFHRERWARLRP
jgi:LPS sulfotransferase NodH